MRKRKKMEKPTKVLQKIIEGDTKALKEMGREGGIKSGENRRANKAEREALKEEFLRDAATQERELHPMSEEGDILPPPTNQPSGGH
jgi:hypothetical protein